MYYYKVGDGDYPYKVANDDALKNAINSICPNDNSTCHTEMVRADPKEQTQIGDYNAKIENQNKINGGSKNKKKHRRTKRRTSSKSHRMRTYRRTSQRSRMI